MGARKTATAVAKAKVRALRAQLELLTRPGSLLGRPFELVEGVKALRAVLRRMRWDGQGGYVGYEGNGRWSFISTGLGQVTPEELNALFRLAGIEPDEIVSLGDCSKCANGEVVHGRRQERGYREPCLTCKRPRMSNFVPLERVKRKAPA
jgi:hypothetical protein